MDFSQERSMPRLSITPMRQSSLNNSSVGYEEDELLSNSSYHSHNPRGCPINVMESSQQISPAHTTTKTTTNVNVRKMVKLFDSVAKSSTTSMTSTPLSGVQQRRSNTMIFGPPKLLKYNNDTGNVGSAGSGGGGGGGSGGGEMLFPKTNVKQQVTQLEITKKLSPFMKIERCRRCKTVKRCDCTNADLQQRLTQRERERERERDQNREFQSDYDSSKQSTPSHLNGFGGCGNGSHSSDIGHHYHNHSHQTSRCTSREPSEQCIDDNLTRQPSPSSEVSAIIDRRPIENIYKSKTTIMRTQKGVRIIVDINMADQMMNLWSSEVVGSRVETDLPQSRILEEFNKQMLTLAATNASN